MKQKLPAGARRQPDLTTCCANCGGKRRRIPDHRGDTYLVFLTRYRCFDLGGKEKGEAPICSLCEKRLLSIGAIKHVG